MDTNITNLTEAQAQSQMRVDQLNTRIDEFIFHAQRLFTQQATILERVDARTERLEAIVGMLDRNYNQQQSQLNEFRVTTNATLERVDRILDYLMRQQGR